MTTRALASDFDGTLFFMQGHPSHRLHRMLPQDLAAIKKFQAEGGLFGICTGRSVPGVHVSLKNKVSLDFLIACSGAEIFGKGGEVIERHQLLNDEAREVVELVMARGLKPVVATDSSYYRINAPLLPLFGLPIKSADKVEDVKEPIYSISLTAKTPDEACQTAALINEKFSDNLVAYQNVESVDVVPKGCSKGTGFLTVKRHFGVDVMGGIGDSFNDLPLLEAADVAYTFNRVPEGVQRAADVLVDTEAEALADLSSR